MESLFVFLSNLILFLSLATLVFAVGASIAMLLSRRKPSSKKHEPKLGGGPLLKRYIPPERDPA